MKSDTKWRANLKADYITGGSTLPPSLAFPRFLLGTELRTTTKEIYAILLDMAMNGEGSIDSRGRRYLTFINPDIVVMIDPQEWSASPWRN